MPQYTYRNPDTGEEKDIFQGMNDKHTYSEGGIQWERVFYAPQASIDANIDPFSKRAFIDKTNKPGTIGDLWDRNKELSMKRAAKNGGEDPIRTKKLKEYNAERRGRKHQSQKESKTIEF
jgi:hypothetical protein